MCQAVGRAAIYPPNWHSQQQLKYIGTATVHPPTGKAKTLLPPVLTNCQLLPAHVPQCFLLPGNCVCGRVPKFTPRTKVVINMHPDEWGKGRHDTMAASVVTSAKTSASISRAAVISSMAQADGSHENSKQPLCRGTSIWAKLLRSTHLFRVLHLASACYLRREPVTCIVLAAGSNTGCLAAASLAGAVMLMRGHREHDGQLQTLLDDPRYTCAMLVRCMYSTSVGLVCIWLQNLMLNKGFVEKSYGGELLHVVGVL
jgi:hypothetical protein